MTKVLFTIDFDGVISPYDSSRDFVNDSDFVMFKMSSFQCPIAKTTLALLQKLKALEMEYPDAFTIFWASSWADLTEYFHEDSKGQIPIFPWLKSMVYLSKGEAIVKAAKEESATRLVVLEDDRKVHNKVRSLCKNDELLANLKLNLFKTKLETGLTLKDALKIENIYEEILKDRDTQC